MISKKLLFPLLLFIGTVLLIFAFSHYERVSSPLEYGISQIENTYQQWFGQQNTSNPLLLLSLAFLGGLLAAVLAAAAATGSQILSTLTMVSYALGYTAVIFFASLFAGLIKQSRKLLSQSDWVIRLGSVALILAGGYYLFTGIRWFF